MKKLPIFVTALCALNLAGGALALTALADEGATPTFAADFYNVKEDGNAVISRNANNDGSIDISLATAPDAYRGSVVAYDTKLPLSAESAIEIEFTINNFNVNGELWFALMDSDERDPLGSGNGLGVKLYDEGNFYDDSHAMEYKPFESLRLDSFLYTESGPNNTGLHRTPHDGNGYTAGYDIADGADGFMGERFVLKAYHAGDPWGYAIQLFKPDGTYLGGGADFGGLDASFPLNRCVLMIGSGCNLAAEESYAENTEITIHRVCSDGQLFSVENVATEWVGSSFKATDRVVVENTASASKLDLTITDGDTTSTRAYFSEKINIKNVFETDLTIDQFNKDGYLQIAFLAGGDDYPMENYGDGFAIRLWDETAWNYPELTSLHSDWWVYGKDGTKSMVKDGRLTLSSIVGATLHIKAWEFDGDNLAVDITSGDQQVIGTIAKSALPSAFNFEDCYLLVAPGKDDSRPHSYEKNMQLTFANMTGLGGKWVDLAYNVSASYDNAQGSVTVKDKAYVGELVCWTIAPSEGYKVKSATLNGEAVEVVNGTVTAMVAGDMALAVEFEQGVTVTTNVTENGGVATPSATIVGVGESVTWTILPASGYGIKTVKFNGAVVETVLNEDGVATYTAVISENSALDVEFALQYTIRYYEGTTLLATKTAYAGEKFPAYTPDAKEGKEFKGWFTDRDCTVAFDAEKVASENLVVYALWTDVKVEEPASSSSSQKSGCMGSVSALACFAPIVFGAALMLKKGKKEE